MWIYNRKVEDYEWIEFVNPKKSLPPDVHKMNKNEAKMLRKLMAQTGMNEAQVRSIKKYRKALSDAQDKGETPLTWNERLNKAYKEVCRKVSRESGLPPWHPKFIRTLNKEIERQRTANRWGIL